LKQRGGKLTIRVYDLAKELKISTMALKKHLTDLGVNVKSHMSLIDEEVADKIRIKYKEQVDAEKRAERDRKRLIEMRQAAKAKQETPEPEAKKEPEIIAPVVEQITVVPEPEEVKPIAEPEKKVAKPVQEKAEERTLKPAPQKEKPVSPPKYSKPSKPEVVAPKPSTLHKKDAGKTEQYKHKPSAQKGTKPVVVAPVPEPIKEVEERKFGKAKVSHEELGEKSKHKKAIISSSKKAKQKIVDVIEIDEAEISRNIKKTLQKSSKRKKYHREAQTVEERSNEIVIREFTSVSELAKIMNVAPSEIISKFFMMGQLVTMNQRLDKDSLEMICDEFKVDFRFEDEYGMDIIGANLNSIAK
jgi:translation initiation factor IF-2